MSLRVLYNSTMISCGLISIVFLTVPKLQFGDFLTALVHRGALSLEMFITISAVRGDSQLRASLYGYN